MKHQDTSIRKATAEDVPKLIEIDTVAASNPARAKYISRVVSHDEVWICIVDDQITGYAVMNRSFFDRATIDMIMVAAGHRRSGCGTLLLNHVERTCDHKELWTSTNLSNAPMQRLLVRSGYQMTGFIDNLDPGDPELVFYKRP